MEKELSNYGTYLKSFLDIWYWGDGHERRDRQGPYNFYGPQLWTIPIEFDCSMILFMLVAATARCSSRVRLTILTGLIIGLLFAFRWDVALFVAGMALAELNIIAAERKLAREEPRVWLRAIRSLVPWTALIIGWYLTGFPTGKDIDGHTGYGFLIDNWDAPWPDKLRFWLSIAAMLVVGSLSFLPIAQRAFTTSIARYLGKISYAFYVVHFFMQLTLRNQLWNDLHVVEDHHSISNPLSWGYILSMLIDIPVTLWVADIFWRTVDAPSVELAKWLEAKCFMQRK
jgi:peptidoglycan/LPS O-acetylase OafA/YrhL